MSAIELSYCVLIFSGAFALIALGVFFIYGAKTLKEVTKATKIAEDTLEKSNELLDDVNSKMELINPPIEFVSGIFNYFNNPSGLFSKFTTVVTSRRKKKKYED